MTSLHFERVHEVAISMFGTSREMFWDFLPIAFLLAMIVIYTMSDISGQKFEGLFRRMFIAIALLAAFPQISSAIQGVEGYLIHSFGGDQHLSDLFSRIGDKAKEVKDLGAFSWIRLGEVGLTIITTLSFLVLSVVHHFLDVLHIVLWNLLHILGPLALLASLFPSLSMIPKGIFMGMLEISLWKPFWIILARILLAIGFGESPADVSAWFDTAIMNFAVAGIMASVPMLVHGFLSGSVVSTGTSALQTMLTGSGAALLSFPMRQVHGLYQAAKAKTIKPAKKLMHNKFRRFSGAKQKPRKHAVSKTG